MAQRCPHCQLHVEPHSKQSSVYPPRGFGSRGFAVIQFECPVCKESWLWLIQGKTQVSDQQDKMSYGVNWSHEPKIIFPDTGNQIPAPSEVPEYLANDFNEACKLLPISARASAAISRRCLQALLTSKGYANHNLVNQIDAFIKETNPDRIAPRGIREQVDAIRNFGNFAAHPMSDTTTLQIIDVEPHEAEWCVDILRSLFDFYFVEPAHRAAKVAELNRKLQSAGKPPAKA